MGARWNRWGSFNSSASSDQGFWRGASKQQRLLTPHLDEFKVQPRLTLSWTLPFPSSPPVAPASEITRDFSSHLHHQAAPSVPGMVTEPPASRCLCSLCCLSLALWPGRRTRPLRLVALGAVWWRWVSRSPSCAWSGCSGPPNPLTWTAQLRQPSGSLWIRCYAGYLLLGSKLPQASWIKIAVVCFALGSAEMALLGGLTVPSEEGCPPGW